MGWVGGRFDPSGCASLVRDNEEHKSSDGAWFIEPRQMAVSLLPRIAPDIDVDVGPLNEPAGERPKSSR